MIAASGSVVGIDIGCSPTRHSSAICRLDWTSSSVTWEIERFRALEPERKRVINEVAGGRRIAAAAFDGPLRRGFDIIGHYRPAEQMLTRRLRPLIGKPGQSSAPIGKLLNQHANECVRHVIAHCDVQNAMHGVAIDQRALVEAFPSSFLGLMIEDPGHLAVRRSNRSDVFFRHLATAGTLDALVKHCLPGRRLTLDPKDIVNHDDRASFVCALTALAVAAGDYVSVGDRDDGWIILPPRRYIRQAQWELLRLNATDAPVGALHVEEPGM